jgi:DNA-directed RNA polymerase specialized sigma24 family protein
MKFQEIAELEIPAAGEKLFYELYESAFPIVARFVGKMNGSFEDAKDIFQESIIIYYEKLSSNKLTITAAPEAYVLGIAKHLWIKKHKRDQKKISLDAMESHIQIPADFFPSMNEERILQILELTGKKCLDLLRAFYYQRKPVKEIMNFLGYRNEHSATVQKYKCLERVRNTVKEKQLTYEDFFE